MAEFEQFGDSSLDRFVRSARAGGMVRADMYAYSRAQDSATLQRVLLSSAAVALIVAAMFAPMLGVALDRLPELAQIPGILTSLGIGTVAGGLFLWLELEVHTLRRTKLDGSTQAEA